MKMIFRVTLLSLLLGAVAGAFARPVVHGVLVVSGEVVSVRDSGVPHIGSEHDADWKIAKVKVSEVLKGDKVKTIDVYFPASNDVMWFRSPKFAPGQKGIWILHWTGLGPNGGTSLGYTALQPIDFQTPDQLQHVKDLIKSAKQ